MKIYFKRFERLNDAFQKLESKFQISLNSLIKWVGYLIEFKKTDEAIYKIEKYLNDFKSNKDLWTFYLRLKIKQNDQEDRILEIFYKSIENIKQNETLELWEMIIDWSLESQSTISEKILQSGSSSMVKEISSLARMKYLEWAEKISDSKLEEVYLNLRREPPYSYDFFLKYIYLQKLRSNEKNVESAYDDALLHFGNEIIDLWIEYMCYKQKNKKAQDIASLYWRAMKELNSDLVEAFSQKFCLFKINSNDETKI